MYLYNSLSRKKEAFVPRNEQQVSLYVCGVTPYDTTHLGHAFTYMAFDALIRYLTYQKKTVTYVQNVTDIDDDILKRAKRDQRDWRELGTYWTDRFLNDMNTLGMVAPTHYVKATDSVPMIITLVQALIAKGCAYEREGTVYFDVKQDASYGSLSGFSPEQMLLIARERGGNPDDPKKKQPLDFILWQRSQADEPAWDSPWGNGRPGWHIECTAMIHQYLGEQIDIHGGGRDLVYPHHESEIAQSECATGKMPYVKYWMHTAMLQYQGEKMAKSLGNLIMVADLLKTYTPAAIRWVLLSHHYRLPWEFQDQELVEAQHRIDRILAVGAHVSASQRHQAVLPTAVTQRLDDDLDTPAVLRLCEEFLERNEQAPLLATLSVLGFSLNS